MIYLTNIFDLPFLFLIMLIDTYLFLVSAKFLIGLSAKARQTNIYNKLISITDPVPKLIYKSIFKGKTIPEQTGLLWLAFVGVIIVLRQIIISIILL